MSRPSTQTWRYLLPAVCACAPPEAADLVLYDGNIVTADHAFAVREAVVIRGDRIVAVGRNGIRHRYIAAQEIDLEGRTVVPGFNDSHIHISGDPPWAVDLTGLTSMGELTARVRSKAASLEDGEWITGYGWSEDELAEQRRPLRWDLDGAAPRNPVVLTRAGGHSAVANSLALNLAEITRRTPDPDGGVIERDASGEPNGIIRERQGIVTRLVPRAAREDLRPSFVANLRALLSLGITSIVQAGVSPDGYEEWERVYAEYRGELPRASVQVRWAGAERMREFSKRTGDGDEHLRVGAAKVYVDGGFTGPAAYTIRPYKNEDTYRGKLRVTEQELAQIVNDAHETGWQLGFHAIGDAAIQLTVAAFVEALETHPRPDHRHYLNHFTVMPPAETMELMAEHGIHITQQPNFTYTVEGRYVEYLDGGRLQHNNPLRTPMNHGVFVALSSDMLPIGPIVGLYAAVTRKGMSGTVYGPDERLAMEEAIRAYTMHGAYLTFEEEEKGSIEPGKLADLVVLSDDIMRVEPEDIMDIEVVMTILGGRIVFER